jgi:hypothetical protein
VRRAVILGERGVSADLGGAAARASFRPTREQRTAERCPAQAIQFVDFDGQLPQLGTDAAGHSVLLYRPVTERLTARRADTGETYYFLSFVNGLRGREQEYDRWYLEHHIHELLLVPGFAAAQRFTLERALREDLLPAFNFLGVYEIRTSDLARTIAGLESHLKSGLMTETPYKDPSRRLQVFVESRQ